MSLRYVRFAAAAGLAAFALAACSSNPAGPQVASVGSGSSSPTTASSTTAQDPAHVWAQWAACMRSHGAQISDPTLNAQNQPQFNTAQMAAIPESVKSAARQACQSVIANIQSSGPTKSVDPKKAVTIANCMRTHGIADFPDPDPATGALVLPLSVQSEPGYPAAYKACTSGGTG